MRPNAKADAIRAEKILKYIVDIKDCFEHFSIKSYNDLKSKRLAQLAVTQIITSIYELKKNITPDALTLLPEFNKIKIAGARNIASHDYERINFKIIYDICDMLIRASVVEELEEVISHAGSDKS